MFTGLVEEVGVVKRLERRGEAGRLSIEATKVLEGTLLGDSIAVSGACLTVVELGRGSFVVDCMPETLTHTTLGSVTAGACVNLERSMTLGGRLGGHLVLGHVDAVSRVKSVAREGNASRITFTLPVDLSPCVAPKGSISIDGISLTVIGAGADFFDVGIIPHTLAETTLKNIGPGTTVNIEVDVLARYVQRTVQALIGGGEPIPKASGSGGLTESFLRDQGFM